MKNNTSIFILLAFVLAACNAAQTPCKKDTCYNAIVDNRMAGAPNLASRRNDCSRALRTVIDDDIKTLFRNTTSTVTISINSTSTSTSFRTYTTTSTSSTSSTSGGNGGAGGSRRALPTDMATGEYLALEARDKIIVQGSVPKYAEACKDIEAYGRACLCAGVKAAVYSQPLVTSTSTFFSTSTTITATFTTTTRVPNCGKTYNCRTPTDVNYCGTTGACFCGRTDRGNNCIDNRGGTAGFCQTSNDCANGAICLYDLDCGQGRGTCVFENACRNTLSARSIFERDGKEHISLTDPAFRPGPDGWTPAWD